jgi:hypothetical protein
MKHIVKTKSEVGKKGPGTYVYPITNNGIQRFKVVTHTGDKTNVEQSALIETDLNRLLEPAIKNGLLRHAVKFEGEYDDIPVTSYEEAQILIAQAKSMYEELPSAIRSRFDGPKGFLEFTNNPANAKEMERMGILKGNDGKTRTNVASGAPTPTDKDGDGVPDPVTTVDP